MSDTKETEPGPSYVTQIAVLKERNDELAKENAELQSSIEYQARQIETQSNTLNNREQLVNELRGQVDDLAHEPPFIEAAPENDDLLKEIGAAIEIHGVNLARSAKTHGDGGTSTHLIQLGFHIGQFEDYKSMVAWLRGEI